MINIFPTSIYKYSLPEYVRWISRRWEHHRFNQGLTGELDGKVLVHQDPQLASFFCEVNDHIVEYMDSMNCFYDVHFMKTWYAVTDEERSVPDHCHDPAHISWIYYVETQDPLHFQADAPNEWFPQAFADLEKTFNNTTVWAEPTEPGDLFIFPSKLHHHTFNTGPRMSLAGDVLLTNPDLNREGGLTHPKYWKQF